MSCAVATAFFDPSNLDTDSHEYNPTSARETSSIVNKLSTMMVPSLKYGSLFVILVASTTLSPFFQTNFANVPFVLHFKVSLCPSFMVVTGFVTTGLGMSPDTKENQENNFDAKTN